MGNPSPRSGAELVGAHPLLVISNDGLNQTPSWMSIIVVPISSSARSRPPLTVEIPAGIAGLTRDSRAVCHQVTTIDRSKLTHYIGTLSVALLVQIENALKAVLDLP
jgi:mRNA interferase MazF